MNRFGKCLPNGLRRLEDEAFFWRRETSFEISNFDAVTL